MCCNSLNLCTTTTVWYYIKMLFTLQTLHFHSLQVVSLLRQKHDLKVVVCPLGYVNYVVSNRMALQRFTVSGK